MQKFEQFQRRKRLWEIDAKYFPYEAKSKKEPKEFPLLYNAINRGDKRIRYTAVMNPDIIRKYYEVHDFDAEQYLIAFVSNRGSKPSLPFHGKKSSRMK